MAVAGIGGPQRIARSNAEEHLYMELNPCPGCGEVGYHPRSSVIVIGDDLASRFAGPCPGCGQQREFVFLLPPDIMVAPDGQVRFGDGDRPSEVIDAGEWLWTSERYVTGLPSTLDGLGADQRRRARQDMSGAIAALDEAIKFIPAGADTVPDAAFWSARGRAIRDAEPGRFRRARLCAVRGAYQEIADRWAGQ